MSNNSVINTTSQEKLSVRLISADSYQCTPIQSLDPSFSEFRGSEIKQVPVIRIFGTTSTGDKICLHIHGVFPYMYIPYTNLDQTDSFVYRLAASLDSAINVSLGTSSSSTQHIYKIQHVTGKPFYGYHKKKHKYLKIYFYNPAMVKRATELLQNGSIMSQTFQPHEAHIPFILQFMMDYNIYGMSFVDLKDVYYRRSMQSSGDDMFSHDVSSEDNKKYLPNTVARQSTCAVEVDALAQDIINKEAIENGIDQNPGIAAIWEEEKLRRILAGLPAEEPEMACSLTLQREIELPPTDNDIYQQERFARRLLNVTQNPESDVSSMTTLESYPLVADDNEDFLNASNVENHLSGPKSNETFDESNSNFEEELSASNISDMSLVDILVELANDAESQSAVDEDSILGSQANLFESEECPSDNEDEVVDLNMTTWELDSWDFGDDQPQSPKSTSSVDTISPRIFEDNDSSSEVSGTQAQKTNPRRNIPAFDGPCDSTSSDSDEETNFTIESTEMLACAYKPAKENLISTPPSKKRVADDRGILNSGGKRRRMASRVLKTPTRSPSCRSVNSPGSSRNYSPLNIQVVTTPKSSDKAQRRVLTDQKKMELAVLKSIKKTDVTKLLKGQDDDILAENSDESPSEGSPILSRKRQTKATKLVARKLFSNKNSMSQEETNPHIPGTPDVISETSEDVSSSDVEDVTLLMSPDQQDTFSQTSTESSTIDKYISLRPKYNPPSRDRIVSTMDIYDIPKCRYQEPFYNNEEDVDGQKEMAHKILKVPSKGLSSLQQFVSELEDIRGIDYWRNSRIQIFDNSQANMNVDKLSIEKRNYAGHSTITITPLNLPPSRKRIEVWLKAREYIRKKKEKEQKEKLTNINPVLKEKAEFRDDENVDDDDDDDDKTVCESICSNEDTLIEETEVVNLSNVELSQKMQSSNESETVVDASVKKMLDNTNFLTSVASFKNCGVSCGQIEFLSDTTRENVEVENRHAKALAKNQFITILCLEVHIETREDLTPDPQYDAMKAVFYSVQNDVPPTSPIKQLDFGAFILNTEESDYVPKNYINVKYVKSEKLLIEEVIQIVTHYDPEILIGWEIENLSWGYISQRAAFLGVQFLSKISRIPKVKHNWEPKALEYEAHVDLKLPGRIVLELWRTMRHEVALNSYTFESIMHDVMNERVPYFSWQTLTQYSTHPSQKFRCKVIDYYTKRVLGVLRILEQLDIIGRTSEFARLYGVQFFEVFSRGSQFRVESMMLRIAKPCNYIAVSPSNQQRAAMRAPEALPLIMEPESRFYSDPLVVLDFQSLYPSIIIAYNYCFSTCVGRVEHIGQSRPFTFGASTLKVNKKLAMELEGKLNFSPCGVGFVKQEVRRGILPQMLTEILNTRLMVKKAIKDHSSDDKTLQRVLHSRQLGLKLIANVTYGYTAANFSGRMPCIEVGDSVVSKGKETLERAIRIVETTPRWGARVVYGDTDSLFILLKGKTRKEAFEIGYEMADVITQANPAPVKLKFEKVLQPSILQTKKRYCGYMYESVKDEKPVYLAKGIETVRRDGCPAVSKMLAKTLKILFETKDVSQIKDYVTRQFDKILQGKVSIEDLTFAREFRGLRGYRPNACVPALELTKRLMKHDPRAVPRNHDRVRYVIVAGAPNETLIRCVRSPMEVIKDPGLRLNSVYYITRVIIPPLNRCLNLIGADAHLWFNKMPHRTGHRFLDKVTSHPLDKQKITISQYFDHAMCKVCGKPAANKEICEECKFKPMESIITLTEKNRQLERIDQLIKRLCYSCLGEMETIKCESLDCPIFYRRNYSAVDIVQTSNIYKLIDSTFDISF